MSEQVKIQFFDSDGYIIQSDSQTPIFARVSDYAALERERDRYREALKYYAERENYYIDCSGKDGGARIIDIDEGLIARQALEGTK